MTTTWSKALHITVSAVGVLAAVVVLIRLNGLSSLVLELSEVYTVVLESNGDISVLHGNQGKSLDAGLLGDVRGAEYVVSGGEREAHPQQAWKLTLTKVNDPERSSCQNIVTTFE